MSISLSSRQPDHARLPIRYNDQVVGFLVEDMPQHEREDGRHVYRFAALDSHFVLLDGSRFMAPHRAYAAIARLSRFVDRPPAANQA